LTIFGNNQQTTAYQAKASMLSPFFIHFFVELFFFSVTNTVRNNQNL